MRCAKPILIALLALGLVGYALDCSAMSTPDEAMQCCNTMPCSPHGHQHGEDCCKTMPSMHAPFVQPSSVHGVSLLQMLLAVIPGVNASQRWDSSAHAVTAHCHAPPVLPAVAVSPLRV
jgi:hypothetical protein